MTATSRSVKSLRRIESVRKLYQERLYTIRQITERTGVSRWAICNHINESLLTPIETVRLPTGHPARLFTASEVAGYENYLISAGLMKRKRRHMIGWENQRKAMKDAVSRHGIKMAAELFGIKPESLQRNLRNWRKTDDQNQ